VTIQGNYTDYREWRDAKPRTDGRADTRPAGTVLQNQAPAPRITTEPVNGHANGAKKKLSFREIREYETLETEIETLEQRKTEITNLLNGGGHHQQLSAWAREIEEIDQAVAQKSDRWLELAEHM
jgi:ATP-binding cassette subfamily F protein uup